MSDSDRTEESNNARRLTDGQKSELIAVAESLVPSEEIHSICAYGPRVEGYGKDGSKCSLIIVTKNSRGEPGGEHESERITSSLIVDEAILLNAALRPTFGESVVGLLLNVYEPLVNAEFLRMVEIEYKKRIMAEELIEMQADYGDFSSNLIIPYEYFLFDKLHERASEFPDAIGGYVRAYSGVQRTNNLEFANRGFREAAELFASQGIVDNSDGLVRIFRQRKRRRKSLSLLLKMYPFTTGGAIQNARHSFASTVGIGDKTQPLPKPDVAEDIGSIVELDRPKKLLRLEEGVVFDDGSKMIDELAIMYGFGENYHHEEKKKGDITNSSTQIEIWNDDRRMKFMAKQFPQLKSAKWVLIGIWSVAAKRFNVTPLSRLNREVEAVRRLHGLGVRTHRIAGVVLDERTLVTEYSEGVSLDEPVREITAGTSNDTSGVEEYARVLGKLHEAGLVYGDTKPHNALVSKDGVDLLDLEQAEERGDKAWDLAEFLYYSARMAKQEDGMKLVADSFLAAYRNENGSQVIEKARRLRYLLPFLPFIAPRMRRVVRDSLARYSVPDGE
ncbi:MAG: lipopolysaccharide kinase InaA family protein [Methanomassiliicoccales archaeon]|jgi:tRNA A-37 threonylcarbamoyl transferase component Bud32